MLRDAESLVLKSTKCTQVMTGTMFIIFGRPSNWSRRRCCIAETVIQETFNASSFRSIGQLSL
ncbi:hypothetical protein CHS0354_020029 [Potamilus streckersoni]|uniref:Uncharacterized protein n=1 Tax=Potamilus streckersoni TaxID=2493646 RepID=A0AAE0VRU8_9BIVA|nr:hypothetical protein CHS0354_020029 [Potamilus streckersoni]